MGMRSAVKTVQTNNAARKASTNAACTYEVKPRPGKLKRWCVPASRCHDDLLISTALTARLDDIDWRDRKARASAAA